MISHTSCHYLGAVIFIFFSCLVCVAMACSWETVAERTVRACQDSLLLKTYSWISLKEQGVTPLIWIGLWISSLAAQDLKCVCFCVCVCVCVCVRMVFLQGSEQEGKQREKQQSQDWAAWLLRSWKRAYYPRPVLCKCTHMHTAGSALIHGRLLPNTQSK